MWFLFGEFFNLCSSYVNCSAFPVCFILLRITLFLSSLWAGSWKNLFDAKKKKKKKPHMGALGSQKLFNLYNKWHWLGLFYIWLGTFHILPCVLFLSSHTEDFPIELILLSLEPCHFFFLGSFSISCIFLWWDLCSEESEQTFPIIASFHPLFLEQQSSGLNLVFSLLSAVRLGTGLLSLGSVDIWSWIILCGGSLMHCSVYSSNPGLYTLDVSSTTSPSCDN